MKKGIIVGLALMLVVGYVFAIESDNKERLWEQTQEFKKPVKENNSKAGAWEGSQNIGTVDPKNIFVFEDEFVSMDASITADANVWLSTVAPTLQNDRVGGEVWMGAAGGTLANMQVNGEAFQITNNKKLNFEARVTLDDVDKTDWFIGLAVEDTSILGNGVTDRIGFVNDIHDGDVDFVVEKNNVTYVTDTGFDLSDSTAVRLGFTADGSYTTQQITAYVDDMAVAIGCTNGAGCTNSPYDEVLTPTIEIRKGEAFEHKLMLDYIKVQQER